MNKKNEYQDEGLKGNERIEDAIFALQKEATQEQLAHTLTVIRRRMKEGRIKRCRSGEVDIFVRDRQDV